METDQSPGPELKKTGNPAVWSILLGFIGLLVGLIAGFVLFASSYPFLGPPTTPVWKVSIVDGLVISVVGVAAFRFRRRSSFIQGVLISSAILFIVNGLCGVSGR